MFKINNKGEKEFIEGRENCAAAEIEAEKCSNFKADVEEEQVSDVLLSCYNCRFRRWTPESFVCLKKDGAG